MSIWLPYVREDDGPWRVLCRPSIHGAYRFADAACQAAREIYPDLPHPSPGAISTSPATGVRLMLAPTNDPPVSAPPPTRACPSSCPLHPHQPLSHLTGHTTTGIRTATLLARSGYVDLADIANAHHSGLLHDLPNLGPSGRSLLAALANGHQPPEHQPDLHRLSTLLTQAQSLTHSDSLHPVHLLLTQARQELKRLTSKE